MAPNLLRLLYLVLLSVSIRPAACTSGYDGDPSEANEMRSKGKVMSTAMASQGIMAALIHRDHFSVRRSTVGADEKWSSAEILRDEARRSLKRAESLRSRIRHESPSSSSPASSLASQDVDWEPELSFADPEYLMEISLGTPPQTFVLQVDTGSDLAWVRCLPVQTDYNETDPPFDPSKSSTYVELSCASSFCESLSTQSICDAQGNCIPKCEYSPSAQGGSNCSFSFKYGIGAANGTLAEDTMHIRTEQGGVQPVPNFWFGCSHNTTDFGVADGIFGLGRSNFSFSSRLGRYFGSVFAYCLVNGSRSKSEKSLLIFGDDALSPRTSDGTSCSCNLLPYSRIQFSITFKWRVSR